MPEHAIADDLFNCQRLLREQAILLDHTRDAIVLHDADQRIASWNGGAARMFGHARHDALGRRFEHLTGPAAVLPPHAHQQLHTAAEFEGTGIGLAMVRKIVSRHHGSIWAESRPGAGAAFRFTLGDRRGGVPAGPTHP